MQASCPNRARIISGHSACSSSKLLRLPPVHAKASGNDTFEAVQSKLDAFVKEMKPKVADGLEELGR